METIDFLLDGYEYIEPVVRNGVEIQANTKFFKARELKTNKTVMVKFQRLLVGRASPFLTGDGGPRGPRAGSGSRNPQAPQRGNSGDQPQGNLDSQATAASQHHPAVQILSARQVGVSSARVCRDEPERVSPKHSRAASPASLASQSRLAA